MQRQNTPFYFVPPIIEDDATLVREWLNDMETVKEVVPQGELISISEIGNLEDFVEKSKERLCSAAQLEIMKRTRENMIWLNTLQKESNMPIITNLEPYTKGARCTFPDYQCPSGGCTFTPQQRLERKI